ncbi:lipopolysaccharide-induced tumor necrosis factor-alpha factor-like protein, partial [Leptotrombidium deliense]
MSQTNCHNLHPPMNYMPNTPSETLMPHAPPPTACSNQVAFPPVITPIAPHPVPHVIQPTQIVVTGDRFGPSPCRAMCHNCHSEVITYTKPVVGGITWLVSGIICIVGCVCGCCLIPFFVDS